MNGFIQCIFCLEFFFQQYGRIYNYRGCYHCYRVPKLNNSFISFFIDIALLFYQSLALDVNSKSKFFFMKCHNKFFFQIKTSIYFYNLTGLRKSSFQSIFEYTSLIFVFYIVFRISNELHGNYYFHLPILLTLCECKVMAE